MARLDGWVWLTPPDSAVDDDDDDDEEAASLLEKARSSKDPDPDGPTPDPPVALIALIAGGGAPLRSREFAFVVMGGPSRWEVDAMVG